jgi:hypothetical protein
MCSRIRRVLCPLSPRCTPPSIYINRIESISGFIRVDINYLIFLYGIRAGLFADKTDRIEFILATAIYFVDAMASSSSAQIINLGSPPSDKLTRANYSGWRAQVLPPIRGARLFGLLDGSDAASPETLEVPPDDKTDADQTPKKINNPAYDTWISRDQIVLGYLLQSIGPEVLPHVQQIETAAGVWHAVEEMFASSCQTKFTNLRITLANTKKLQLSTDAFLTKMQSIVDELAAAGESALLSTSRSSLRVLGRSTILWSQLWARSPRPDTAVPLCPASGVQPAPRHAQWHI